jgi:class 3 adenylate cyclase
MELDRLDQLGTAAVNIGQLYRKEDNLDKALEYLEIGLDAFQEIGGNVATALNFMGGIFSERGEYSKAMKYHSDALEYASGRDAKMEMAQSYLGIGRVNLDQKKYNAAIRSFQNGLNISSDVGLNNSRRNAYEGLAVANGELGNYQKAYEYQKQFTDLVDSLRTEEAEEKLSNLKFQFDYENKQQEISFLNIDNDLKAAQIERDSNLQKLFLAIGAFLLLGLGGIYYQFRYAKKSNALLAIERNKAEEILLNILPKATADELKEKGYVDAKEYKQSTVLFTDFKGFTNIAEKVPAEELVKSIDYYFKNFDTIIDKYGLEKIKTIGDAYMCAGGLPKSNNTNPLDAVQASVAIMDFVTQTKANPPSGIYPFEVRIGINTGPLVAGVVGTKKFQFDIWGSTVNIASRMESSSEAGKINISESTYQQVKEYFECKYRGEIEIKNAGKQKMYYVGSLIQNILAKKEDEFV